MKSQAFDSKRRLTNICCFVVGLGLVKLVFAAYIFAGGTLFSFSSTKQNADPKMEALAKAREQQRLALQKVSGELLVSQKSDAKTQGMVQRMAQSQVSDTAPAAAPKQEMQNAVQNIRQEQNLPLAAEENDGVQPDLLIQASMATIGNMQSQNRRAVLENAFAEKAAQSEEKQAELAQSLEDVKPAYTHERDNDKEFSFSLVGTAHAEEINNNVANNNGYVRPDQRQTSAVIPAPSVNSKGYVSPDTLTYKEKELNQKEEELLSLQEQMSSRMEELNQLENKLGDMVKEANSAEDEKYAHLIQTYTNMKPRKAAEALSTLDEKIAVRILNGMKSKQSGEIFSYMEPMHAARLSKAMTKIANPQ